MKSSCNFTNAAGLQAQRLVIDGLLPDWRLTLIFADTSNTSNKWALSESKLEFNLRNSASINNATNTTDQVSITSNVDKWQASVGNLYKCSASDTLQLNLTDLYAVKTFALLFDNVQVQPFFQQSSNNGTWGIAEQCASNLPTSDVVPIAVGCALAALVVIVLVAYVIGRRRNRARGYESM